MRFFLRPENIRELGKEWELRLLVLLSLFLQVIVASLGNRRKSIVKNWIQVVVQTMHLADSIAILTLGVLSNRLANINETKGMIDPKSQITAFWAPFLLFHLGGTNEVTACTMVDLELWQRQLVQLCIQVGLACYIYSMALSGLSTLSILAAGMILVGFISYAERTLCLYLASKGPLRDSMLPSSDVSPGYPEILMMKLRKQEGYRVRLDQTIEIPDLVVLRTHRGEHPVVQAYKFFEIFKLLFVGLTVKKDDLDCIRPMFIEQWNIDRSKAFEIVDIELGFMYDLLFSKAPLLKCAWVIVRWVISLSVLCAVLVFLSLQDKKDYTKVDIYVTFLLISVAILIEICSILQAISSDWIHHWRLQRPRGSAISSAIARLQFSQSQRWSNVEGQFNLLGSCIRKRKSIFRHPRLAKLQVVVEKNFYISYKKFSCDIKGLIFDRMRDMVENLEQTVTSESGPSSLKLEVSDLMKRSKCDDLIWSLDEMEFDQSILIWHVATELCYHKDRGRMRLGDHKNSKMKMSKLVSRYMLYLLVVYPSMLPASTTVVRYGDTSVEAQKFFDEKEALLSNDEGGSISSVVEKWVHKLFKKEARVHTCFGSCKKPHKSRESSDLCNLCHLLLQVAPKLTSLLFDARRLAHQLRSVDTWDIISKVWVRMLAYVACECKGYEHCESLSRGGELLTHVWLLIAHLGIAQPVQTLAEKATITKLSKE